MRLNWYDFGARMMDEQIGRWMSVDTFAEKYVGMSPYAYCANNPVRLVDKDGKDIYVYGVDAAAYKTAVQSNTTLTVGYDANTYQMTFSGTPKTAVDKALMSASTDHTVSVNMYTTKGEVFDDPQSGTPNNAILVGGYGGSTVNADGTVETTQFINMDQSQKVEKAGLSTQGVDATHELLESFFAAKSNPGDPGSGGPASLGQKPAHNKAAALDPKFTNLDIGSLRGGADYGLLDASHTHFVPLISISGPWIKAIPVKH